MCSALLCTEIRPFSLQLLKYETRVEMRGLLGFVVVQHVGRVASLRTGWGQDQTCLHGQKHVDHCKRLVHFFTWKNAKCYQLRLLSSMDLYAGHSVMHMTQICKVVVLKVSLLLIQLFLKFHIYLFNFCLKCKHVIVTNIFHCTLSFFWTDCLKVFKLYFMLKLYIKL